MPKRRTDSLVYHVPILAPRLVRDGTVVADSPYAPSPETAHKVIRAFVPDDGREHFGILMLNVRNRVIGVVDISTGCLVNTVVHPREVYRSAIVGGAAALVLFHSHPSGDPEPSSEDISVTRRLATAGVLLGIEVVDHIISAGDTFVSLKSRGLV